MRLPCSPSRSLKDLRTPLAFLRKGPRRSLHTRQSKFDAAVIGAGITGLTAAYRLSKDPACSKITIYEKAPRVGGWLQSETVSVDGGDIVFEYGPRTIRTTEASCVPLLDLLNDLQLEDQILLTPKSAAASQNRYIYYPDHLVRAPAPKKGDSIPDTVVNTLQTLFSEPLFDTLAWSILKETFVKPLASPPEDESVMEFISRRLSPQVANNLVSALYHGILAGDIDRLSAQAIVGRWRNYEQSYGSVLRPYIQDKRDRMINFLVDDMLVKRTVLDQKPESHIESLLKLVSNSSTLTFKKGVGQLADSLAAALKKSGKVRMVLGADVKSISQNPRTHDLKVGFSRGDPEKQEHQIHSRLIATNSAPSLARQIAGQTRTLGPAEAMRFRDGTLNLLQKHDYAVTVAVINMYYENPDLLPVKGFGYLIPRSIPIEQNPERALGVIFASESSIGQDTAPGTKITVMMGGHWWDGWKPSDYPDNDTSIAMAQSLLKRHLGITDTPTVARVRLQCNAIPQPTVGHLGRMTKLSESIREDFNNRITLAGAWYAMSGTGVVDSVRQGFLAAAYGTGGGPATDFRGLEKSNDWELEGGIVTAPIRAVYLKI